MKFAKKIVEYDDASEDAKRACDETMKGPGMPLVLNRFKCQAGKIDHELMEAN